MTIKKITSLLIAVLLVMSALVIPATVGAVNPTTTINAAWEVGALSNTTGAEYSEGNNIRSVGYTDVSGFTKLWFDGYSQSAAHNERVYFYNSSKEFINYMQITGSKSTVPATAKYARFRFWQEGGNAATMATNQNSASDKYFTLKAELVVSPSLIDETKKGSISIYKYEMSDVTQATVNGTALQTDAGNVPTGAKLISGVTFKITQVADLTDDYFSGKGKNLPSATAAASMPAIGSPVSKKTDENGFVNFNNLPLGIYLVQETATRNQVVKKVPDFVISLPFVDVESQRWVYDAYIYPKNETKYAKLRILKKNYKDNAPLSGAHFKVEGKDEDNNWITYVTDTATATDGKTGAEAIKNLPVQTEYRITEIASPTGFILEDQDNDNVMNVYIDKDGKVCNTTSHTPYALEGDDSLFEFKKNSKPEIDKFIDKSKGANSNLVKQTTFEHHSNTDRNYYTITVTTPNVDMAKMKYFEVTDTFLHNIKAPRVESVRENNTTALTAGSKTYTATIDGNKATIKFATGTGTQIKKNTKYYISISCFHELTPSPIPNDATLTYSHKTSTDGEKDTITTDKTYTITGAYELLKTDSSATPVPLSGAVFALYASENDAINDTNRIPVVQKEGDEYKTTFTSGTDGKAKVIYLDFGDDIENGSKDYWVAEVKAPNDYVLLKSPIKITVNRQSGSYANTGTRIQNAEKADLPSTGGFGSTLATTLSISSFAIAGALIVVAVIYRRKKSNKAQ